MSCMLLSFIKSGIRFKQLSRPTKRLGQVQELGKSIFMGTVGIALTIVNMTGGLDVDVLGELAIVFRFDVLAVEMGDTCDSKSKPGITRIAIYVGVQEKRSSKQGKYS